MNAQDLMLGDWVSVIEPNPYNGYNCKVCAIRSDSNNVILNYTCKFDALLEEINPIPLTKELLVLNGWEREWINGGWSFNHKDKFLLSAINSNGFYLVITNHGRNIHYVHELQHALRLCGLNDLADKFKVQ